MVDRSFIEGKTFDGPGEKEVSLLLHDLGFRFIDGGRDSEIRGEARGNPVGQIDSLLTFDDKYLFIIEVKSNPETQEVTDFFRKWSDPENIKAVLSKYSLPARGLQPVRVFIYWRKNRPVNDTGISQNIRSMVRGNGDTRGLNRLLFRDDVKYYEEQHDIIGKWARSDLLNYLGISRIGEYQTRQDIPAIQFFMNETPAYLFSTSVYELLGTCFVHRRRDREEGYQRSVTKKRISTIRTFISNATEGSNDFAFPNALLINCLDSLHVQTINPNETEGPVGMCMISLPKDFCTSRIVDGQHRLLGFSKLPDRELKQHYLPVIAFEKLGMREEVNTFIVINSEQRRVDGNLIYLLISQFDYDFDDEKDFYYKKFSIDVVKRLEEDGSSPLEDQIFMGTGEGKRVTLKTLADGLIINKLAGCENALLHEEGLPNDRNEKIEQCYESLKEVFTSLKANLEWDWNSDSPFFTSNQGMRVLFRLIRLFQRNKDKGCIDPNCSLRNFFDVLGRSLDEEFIELLMDSYGEGGAINAVKNIVETKLRNINGFEEFEFDLRRLR